VDNLTLVVGSADFAKPFLGVLGENAIWYIAISTLRSTHCRSHLGAERGKAAERIGRFKYTSIRQREFYSKSILGLFNHPTLHPSDMSPGKLLSEQSFEITPIEKSPEDKHNYGAVLTGLDLNDVSGKSLRFVERMDYRLT
jgi:hypothetical protein